MKQNLRAAGCVKVYADLLRKSMRLLTSVPHLFDIRDVWMHARDEKDAKELKRMIRRHSELYEEYDRLCGCITN